MTHSTADIAVIGAGVAGLCSALALADTGLDVLVLGDVRAGEASSAAAGILDANHGFGPDVLELMRAARDQWPAFLEALSERTGVAVPLSREGVLELATTVHDAERMASLTSEHADWLSAQELAALEPHLAHAQGALRFRHDGAVNPLLLLKALKHAVGRHVHVRVLQQTVSAIAPGDAATGVSLTLVDGTRISAMRVVIACGAWSASLPGIPMHLPVAPVRGQLMSVASKALRHPVMLGAGYVVPRGDGRTILGGTEEHTGFDARHTAENMDRIRRLASEIHPSFASASMLSTWAGLRPMTRDGLPIIGPDAEFPSVVYATGHGRNGILLAPVTGTLVAAAATGAAEPTVPSLFSPLRFS